MYSFVYQTILIFQIDNRGVDSTGAMGALHPSILKTHVLAPVDFLKNNWNLPKNACIGQILDSRRKFGTRGFKS